MSFVATRNKGYAMTFDNGFTISVQWGTENYCEKKHTTIHPTDPMEHKRWDSLSAEIAVFDKEGEFISINGYTLESTDGTIKNVDDVVAGWLPTDKVAEVITIVQSATTKEEIENKSKELLI